MDPNARAKYLNSRETPLFDKGRALYNHGPAREAAGKGQPLIVAEGYMDVIALVQAGFEAAVAPLGTAITADQLRLLWRIADEPVVTLDGDIAGQRAAMRLVDLALPMLEPGKTLRFCIMPEGQDPDDLLKAKGPESMQKLLETALPLVQILWRRETEGQVFDSPERRAALDKRLRIAIGQIPDTGLRRHYGDALAEMRRAMFRPQSHAPARRGGGMWRGRGFAEAALPLAETRSSALGSGTVTADDLRISLILATLCRYPSLLEQFEPDLDRMAPADPDQRALLDHLAGTTAEDAASLSLELTQSGLDRALERLRAMGHLLIAPVLVGPADPKKATLCLMEEFAKLHARRALDHEIHEALEDLQDADDVDPRLNRRLNHAVQARIRATVQDDSTGAEQYGTTSEAIDAFHRLLNTAGDAKKRR